MPTEVIIFRYCSEDKSTANIASRVRWMSIEAAEEGRYSTASDVWSFAVFLLEIFTKGALPYAGNLKFVY